MRIYNAALGRFLSVDPLTPDYPELTPYQFANNTPIQAIDLDGLENYHYTLIREESKGKPIFIISYDRTELTEYNPFTAKDETVIGEHFILTEDNGRIFKFDSYNELMKFDPSKMHLFPDNWKSYLFQNWKHQPGEMVDVPEGMQGPIKTIEPQRKSIGQTGPVEFQPLGGIFGGDWTSKKIHADVDLGKNKKTEISFRLSEDKTTIIPKLAFNNLKPKEQQLALSLGKDFIANPTNRKKLLEIAKKGLTFDRATNADKIELQGMIDILSKE
jgi:hypothetical protein